MTPRLADHCINHGPNAAAHRCYSTCKQQQSHHNHHHGKAQGLHHSCRAIMQASHRLCTCQCNTACHQSPSSTPLAPHRRQHRRDSSSVRAAECKLGDSTANTPTNTEDSATRLLARPYWPMRLWGLTPPHHVTSPADHAVHVPHNQQASRSGMHCTCPDILAPA